MGSPAHSCPVCSVSENPRQTQIETQQQRCGETLVALRRKLGFPPSPIVDVEGGLTGLVIHRDVLEAMDSKLRAQDERQDPAAVSLAQIMTRNAATVDEHDSLRSAALYPENTNTGACRYPAMAG